MIGCIGIDLLEELDTARLQVLHGAGAVGGKPATLDETGDVALRTTLATM